MPKWPAWLMLAFTAACAYPAVTAPPPRPAPASYRAVGTEPFWAVTIADGRMTYEGLDEPTIVVGRPDPRTTFNGRRYETPRLTVHVTHVQCSDGMSDRVYVDTVRVMANGKDLRGCGGEILPPAELAGTSWSITAIDGEAVPRELSYFLNFEEQRLGGKAGCNGFGGSYEVSGRTLVPGPIMATKMACPGPAMEHERRALEILSGPVQMDYRDGDTLVLRGRSGAITLRRAI